MNAVINRVLCVEVPLSQNCSLGGSKQLSFGHPQSTTTHTDRQTLNILPTAEFESVTLSKSETRDHTRSNYSEDLLEQSSMTNSLKSGAENERSAKFNPHKLFQKSNFKFLERSWVEPASLRDP